MNSEHKSNPQTGNTPAARQELHQKSPLVATPASDSRNVRQVPLKTEHEPEIKKEPVEKANPLLELSQPQLVK